MSEVELEELSKARHSVILHKREGKRFENDRSEWTLQLCEGVQQHEQRGEGCFTERTGTVSECSAEESDE